MVANNSKFWLSRLWILQLTSSKLNHYQLYDQGSEFTGSAFQDLLACAGIKSSPATSHNPQGNSVIEAVHKSVGQVLRTLVHLHNPQLVAQADQLSKDALATAMHVTRCASYQALHNMTPGSLALRCDMMFDIPFLTDFIALQHSRQAVIDQRVQRANAHVFVMNFNQ